jgi:hippurate hydrolase
MISRLREIVENIAIGFGATAEVRFLDGYPSTINHPESVEFAADIARKGSW